METSNFLPEFILDSNSTSDLLLAEGTCLVQVQPNDSLSQEIIIDPSQLSDGTYIINEETGELQLLDNVDITMVDGDFEIVTVDPLQPDEEEETVVTSEPCTPPVHPTFPQIIQQPRFRSTPALLRNSRRVPAPPPVKPPDPPVKRKPRKSSQQNQIILLDSSSQPEPSSSFYHFQNSDHSEPGQDIIYHLDDNLLNPDVKVVPVMEKSSRKRKKSPKKTSSSKKPRNIARLKCLEDGCPFEANYLSDVKKHLTNDHEMTFDNEEKTFPSESAFKEWRLEYERERMMSFIYRGGTKKVTPSQSVTYMVCHRSGHYKPAVVDTTKRQRKLKPQGSCKIGGYCTAGIKILKNLDTGEISASVCHTHYGHPLDSEAIPHLRVNPALRKKILKKFEEGMSLTDMLAYIHLNPDGLEGLRLVDRRAIRNIYEIWRKSSKNDIQKDSVPEPLSPDKAPKVDEPQLEITSVRSLSHSKKPPAIDQVEISSELEATIDKLNNHGEAGPTILLYKRIAESSPKYGGFSRVLRPDDFCLIIQTPVQRQIFQMFHKLVSIEVLENKEDRLKLTFLSVLDDYREAIPVCWMISDSTSPRYFNQLFRVLRYHCGQLPVLYIMAPRTLDVLKSWNSHFSHKPKLILNTCSVSRDLKVLLSRCIPTQEVRNLIWTSLEGLINERESPLVSNHQSKLTKLSKQPSVDSFFKKLEKDWLPRLEQWCLAFRTDAPINLEGSSEAFTKLRKFVTFKGTRNLHTEVDHILKIGYDKCFFRTKRMYKGDQKLTNILEKVSSQHNLALEITSTPSPLTSTSWSLENFKVFYLNNPCTCKITCKTCSICCHQYTCSCSTFSKLNLMCSHIHKVHCFRNDIPLNGASIPSSSPPETISIINESDLEELNISQVLGLLSDQNNAESLPTEETSSVTVFEHSHQ